MRHYRAECRPVQCAGGRPVATVSVLIVLLVSYPSGRGGPRCWCLLTARPTRGVRGTKLGDWLLTSPCILAEWIERDVRAKLSRKQGNPKVEGVGYAGQRMGRSKRRRQGQEVKDPATQGDVNNSPQGSSRELCIACDWRVSLVAEWVNKQAKPRQDPSRPSTAAVTLFWRAASQWQSTRCQGCLSVARSLYLQPCRVCVQNVWGLDEQTDLPTACKLAGIVPLGILSCELPLSRAEHHFALFICNDSELSWHIKARPVIVLAKSCNKNKVPTGHIYRRLTECSE
jgi:hypothetical protein